MAMDLDPIKQLQSLLEDRGKVLEKISSIHSALGSLKAGSVAPEPDAPPAKDGQPQTAAHPPDDPVYGRLLHTLHDMQSQIEQRLRPLAEQAVEFQLGQLREQSSHDRATLNACLVHVDQCIVNCIEQLEEYQNKHTFLRTLNQRIANLGATPEPLPDPLAVENLTAVMQARVEGLRRQSKLPAGGAAVNDSK